MTTLTRSSCTVQYKMGLVADSRYRFFQLCSPASSEAAKAREYAFIRLHE